MKIARTTVCVGDERRSTERGRQRTHDCDFAECLQDRAPHGETCRYRQSYRGAPNSTPRSSILAGADARPANLRPP